VFYVDAADAANALGLFASARTLTNEALVIRPGLQFAVQNGSQTYYYENKYVDALKFVEDIKHKGDLGTHYEANIFLALAYYKLGESELARSLLKQIVIEYDGRTSVMNIANKYLATSLMGFILKQTGNIDEGRSVLEGLLKDVELTLNEQFPEKSMILACCYAAMGKQEKCLEALEGSNGGITVNYYDLALFPSFDIMRAEPGFQEIMNGLKERTEEMRENVLAKGYLNDIPGL
jgi:tetratricopeptide (TPR) repeat protein